MSMLCYISGPRAIESSLGAEYWEGFLRVFCGRVLSALEAVYVAIASPLIEGFIVEDGWMDGRHL